MNGPAMARVNKIENVKKHLIRSGALILKAIEQLTNIAPGPQFLLVMDEADRLVGTITDGDIRKSLISRNSLEGSVDDHMQTQPIVANVSDDEATKRLIMNNVRSTIKFLPILNTRRQLEEVIYLSDEIRMDISALIMAGGFGTRLKHETAKKPKALVEVDDFPLIENVLKNIESAGVKNIFVSVHYLGEMIEDYIKQTGRRHSVSVLRETKPLGTAGAIQLISPKLKTDLLIANCDLVTDLRMSDMIDFYYASQTDASIAVAKHRFTVPFGVIRSSPSGRFNGIDEKPTITNYVSAGIYCISRSFMRNVRHEGSIDMPQYLEMGVKSGLNVSLFPLHEEWEDIGTLEQLKKIKEQNHQRKKK